MSTRVRWGQGPRPKTSVAMRALGAVSLKKFGRLRLGQKTSLSAELLAALALGGALLAPGIASAAGLVEQAIMHMREADRGIDRGLQHLDAVDHEVDYALTQEAKADAELTQAGVKDGRLDAAVDELHEAENATDAARTRLHNAENLIDEAIQQAQSEAGS